jgi:hypothetical protein
MRKLIAAAAALVALSAAAPAYAIHDSLIPAGNGIPVTDPKHCSSSNSVAVGDPAFGQVGANPGNSDVALLNNDASPPCHNDPT